MDVSKCSSTRDLVTFVDWIEDAPTVFINFIDTPNKPGRLNCYDGASLKHWLNQSENTFAKWVQRRPGYALEINGHGGMPDLDHQYLKLYTGEFVIKDDIVEKLQKGVKYPVILDADYTEIVRLGNLEGLFGEGDHHGQYPGYRIYQLKTDKPLELEEKPEETEEIEEESEYDVDEYGFEYTLVEGRRVYVRSDIYFVESDSEENNVITQYDLFVRSIFRSFRQAQQLEQQAGLILAEFLYDAVKDLLQKTDPFQRHDEATATYYPIDVVNITQSYERLRRPQRIIADHEFRRCIRDGCVLEVGPSEFDPIASFIGNTIWHVDPEDPIRGTVVPIETYLTFEAKEFVQIYVNMKANEVLRRALTISIGQGHLSINNEDMGKAIRQRN